MSVCSGGYELRDRSMFGLSLDGLSVFLTIFFDIPVPFFFLRQVPRLSRSRQAHGLNKRLTIRANFGSELIYAPSD